MAVAQELVDRVRLPLLLGPAFVAAVAYVDPGNVAANLTAGAQHGHLLVWVLVVANAMAVLIQYLSAKLGLVTGRSLPELVGERWPLAARLAYWGQAELVAIATDIAEVIGGAVGLHLLVGLPLWLGGLVMGVVSMALLMLQTHGQRRFEVAIGGLLGVIVVGFLTGLFVTPVDWAGVAGGLIPRFDGTGTVLLAASMLGATVMPHAIYLHSSLVRDRHHSSAHDPRLPRLLRATRWDVLLSLAIAGTVNIGMIVLAATALQGASGTDTLEGAHVALSAALGPVVAAVFAVGLVTSGLASTSVGAYAGSELMAGLLRVRLPLWVRRAVSLVPALVVLAAGIEPTWALILSQVVLSIGIPFAVVPLLLLTGDRGLMGTHVNIRPVAVVAWVVVTLVIALNAVLVVLTLGGA
ncbi:Nramp family divalent metal transporter [Mariniluteicoccus endophyticus]